MQLRGNATCLQGVLDDAQHHADSVDLHHDHLLGDFAQRRNGRRCEQHPDPRHQLCVHAAGPGDRGLSGPHLARDSADLLRAAVLPVLSGVLPVRWHRQKRPPLHLQRAGLAIARQVHGHRRRHDRPGGDDPRADVLPVQAADVPVRAVLQPEADSAHQLDAQPATGQGRHLDGVRAAQPGIHQHGKVLKMWLRVL
uniref:(northern house mosquito) hypothetical protein n=1 Tax=Culex pipiens TaxID=7175 RepID=A0A8D7ZSP5_CULPI